MWDEKRIYCAMIFSYFKFRIQLVFHNFKKSEVTVKQLQTCYYFKETTESEESDTHLNPSFTVLNIH